MNIAALREQAMKAARRDIAFAEEFLDELIVNVKRAQEPDQLINQEARIAIICKAIMENAGPNAILLAFAVLLDRVARQESFESQVPREGGAA